VGGQPLGQPEARGRRGGGQRLDLRPRPLGVHVVGRQRRHPTEVVDTGSQQAGDVVRLDEVGRGLHARRRSQHQPGHRHGREQRLGRQVVRLAHRRVVLGPEALDDHLLDAAVAPADGADREQRLGPLLERLPDADQHAGRERNGAPPGVLEHPQADVRVLVRAAEVRLAALLEQPPGGRLQHHPHRGRHRLQPLEFLPGQDAGVEVREQPGLLQHPDRHRPHVAERRVVAVGVQPLPSRRPSVLRLVTEGEQRLFAAEVGAAAGDLENLVRAEVGRGQAVRRGREGAVVATVSAQAGEREKDLSAVGDGAGSPGRGEPGVADPGGARHQVLEVGALGRKQDRRLGHVQRHAVAGAAQSPAHRGRGGCWRRGDGHGCSLGRSGTRAFLTCGRNGASGWLDGRMRIVALAGGIGAARFLRGLRQVEPTAEITAIVNTGDDIWLHGLKVCPDLDTVMYTLGGGIAEDRGWGREDETFVVRDELAAYGVGPAWFGLGDRDLATHLVRTQMMSAGYALSQVTAALCDRWSPGVQLLPMTDERAETHVVTTVPEVGRRALHFQEWWIRYGAKLPAESFPIIGIEDAKPAPGVLDALAAADVVLFPPSNPVVSIGTILAVPGIRDALRAVSAPVVGVSPIVGGSPVRGMADACLPAIGVEVSAEGVGRHYGARTGEGLLDGWLVDTSDAEATVPDVEVAVRPLLMRDLPSAAALAEAALEVARALR
jgi:LPPG:FO 2-phospho-L-lactate transferase